MYSVRTAVKREVPDTITKREFPVAHISTLQICHYYYHLNTAAGIVRSIWRLATGWTIEGTEFESRNGQEFSLLHVVQTSSGVRPTSYPMGAGGSSPGGKAAGM
jgi:hypothetical protein